MVTYRVIVWDDTVDPRLTDKLESLHGILVSKVERGTVYGFPSVTEAHLFVYFADCFDADADYWSSTG